MDMLKKMLDFQVNFKDWIDSQDVMKMLHISRRTLHTLRKNGTIPFSRINSKIYFKTEDIDRVLQDTYTMYKIHRNN